MIKSKQEPFFMRDHASLPPLTWQDALDLGLVEERDYDEAIWAFLRIDAPVEIRAWWASWAPSVSDNASLPALVHRSAVTRLQERARDLMGTPQAMRFVMFDWVVPT